MSKKSSQHASVVVPTCVLAALAVDLVFHTEVTQALNNIFTVLFNTACLVMLG